MKITPGPGHLPLTEIDVRWGSLLKFSNKDGVGLGGGGGGGGWREVGGGEVGCEGPALKSN